MCVCERRLMDGLVCAARGIQGGEERDLCVWRGWGDVIDLTEPEYPEEGEGRGGMDRNRDAAEEASP